MKDFKILNISDSLKMTVMVILYCSILIFTGCNDDEDGSPLLETITGEEKTIGNGKVYSWITFDRNDNPKEVGITISANSFSHTTANSFIDFNLPAGKEKTPFDHIGLDWNQHGHEPEGTYNLPHFDIHFYMMSKEDRMNISVENPKMEILPDSKYIPQNYIALPGGVPMMGKHWVDVTSPELNGAFFTTTFLLGSYDGKINFYEPMITLDYLKTEPDTVINFPQPGSFERDAFYPTKYRIKYNDAKEEFIIALTDFEQKVKAK